MPDPPREYGARSGLARPTRYSSALARRICDAVAAGAPLTAACEAADLPNRETVATWLDTHADFHAAYTRALEFAADRYAQEILTIADGADGDASGASKRSDAGGVARAKLRIDTRKWLMSRLAPSKYGDRTAASSAAKPNPGTTNLHDLTDAELEDILASEDEAGGHAP
jgi:hypothetical protein